MTAMEPTALVPATAPPRVRAGAESVLCCLVVVELAGIEPVVIWIFRYLEVLQTCRFRAPGMVHRDVTKCDYF